MRALGLDRDRVVVVQEETGGAFGGKEDYPSSSASTPPCSRARPGGPCAWRTTATRTWPRRPSATRRSSGTGPASPGTGGCVAQDIDIVYDAGAYTTLSAVVLSRGGIHAGGPYACPNVRIRARAAHHQHAAQWGVPRVRRPAVRVRRGDPPRPGGRGPGHVAARDPPPQRVPGGRHHRHRPGAARERRGAGRARGGGRDVRVRAGADGARGREADRLDRAPGRVRDRDRARLARRRLHRGRRGTAGERGRRRADRGRADPRPCLDHGDGPGVADGPRAGRRGGAGRRAGGRGRRAAGHVGRPRQRADGGLADDDGGRRVAGDGGRAPAVATSRRRPIGRSRPRTRTTHASTARFARRSSSTASPASAGATRRTSATRTPRTAGRAPWRPWTWISTRARSGCGRSSRRPMPAGS